MKNINIVNKVISKSLDKPLNVVSAVNSFYWKASRAKLVETKSTTIFWKHIGSITISKYKIYTEIKKVIKRIRITRESEKYSEYTRGNLLNQHYNKLKILLLHRNNLAKDEYNSRIQEDVHQGDEELSSDIESTYNED